MTQADGQAQTGQSATADDEAVTSQNDPRNDNRLYPEPSSTSKRPLQSTSRDDEDMHGVMRCWGMTAS